MTLEQIYGIVRTGLATIGGILVAKGTIDEETLGLVSGAALSLVTAIWSILSKRKVK